MTDDPQARIAAKLDRLAQKLAAMEPIRPFDLQIAIEAGRDALAVLDARPEFPPPIRADGSHHRTPAEKLRNCAELLLRPRIDKQLRAGVAITLRQVADELERADVQPDDPKPCTWPACLSEADQQLLADDVAAGMRGEATVPMPDPRPGCGCVDGSPEDLTRAELQDLVDDQGTDLYKARDLLDFIREMCDQRDASGTPITTADVRDWLGYTGCGGVIVLPDDAVAKLATAGAAPLRTPATTSGESPDKAVTSDNGPDIAGEQP